MNTLIAFVTRSDPESSRGPGQTLTAVLALRPRYVHLLYTDDTEGEMTETSRRILQELPDTICEDRRLDLPDARDYERVIELLPDVLRAIRMKRRGVFHLVSGHPQVRTVMALCLVGRILEGALHDVGDPGDDPWPKNSDGYQRRLRTMDIEMFDRFRLLALLSATSPRLRLNLVAQRAQLDGKKFEVRARPPRGGGGPRPFSFDLLVLLSAKSRFGATPELTKSLAERVVYRELGEQTRRVAIPRAIRSLNRRAARLTGSSPFPLRPLICEQEPGIYILSDSLQPAEEMIAIEGDLRAYLTYTLHYPPTDDEFPFLPRSHVARATT